MFRAKSSRQSNVNKVIIKGGIFWILPERWHWNHHPLSLRCTVIMCRFFISHQTNMLLKWVKEIHILTAKCDISDVSKIYSVWNVVLMLNLHGDIIFAKQGKRKSCSL